MNFQNLPFVLLFGFIAFLFFLAIIGSIALMRQREVFQYYADNTFLWQNEQWGTT
jgi:hypothetical protein